MSNVAIVYWSGTGHTESIAKLVEKGARDAGAQVDLYQPWDFTDELFESYECIAFGCPAMGDEQLETEDFQPLWDHLKTKLSDHKITLFGSYNWNQGEWMDDWMQECTQLDLHLLVDGLAVYDSPKPGSQEELAIAMGKALASA